VGIVLKTIALLLLALPIFFIGGCVGTYRELFSQSDLGTNSTSGLDTAIKLLKDAYALNQAPPVFYRWGLVSMIVYIVIVLVVMIVLCARTVYACGHEMTNTGRRDDDTQIELRQNYKEARESTL
jgi:hypothetical protein